LEARSNEFKNYLGAYSLCSTKNVNKISVGDKLHIYLYSIILEIKKNNGYILERSSRGLIEYDSF